MDNDIKNGRNNLQSGEQHSSDEVKAEYRQISSKEMEQTLKDHSTWVASGGEKGKKADLTCVNLQNANLGKVNLTQAVMAQANLQQAYLWEAVLQEADLQEANFREADLGQANLQKANLLDANLQKAYLFQTKLHQAQLDSANFRSARLEQIEGLSEASLQYTNFDGATGLLGNEFAQADVTGTKLPDEIKAFKALETVKETSQNARKIFFAMLLGCVYSWLAIATTADVKLLTNTASSPLPIIGTEIPIAWFYIAAPLVLLCLYLYFHLYLDNLWAALAGLPAIFPDGKRLDERAYPWLLNTLVRKHFNRLKNRPVIARLKEWITIFLAWWIVPLTMMAFWLRYIPRHDWIGTFFHIALIVFSIGFAIIFYRVCAMTLKGERKRIFQLKFFLKDGRFYLGLGVVVIAIVFMLLSFGAIEGNRFPISLYDETANASSTSAIQAVASNPAHEKPISSALKLNVPRIFQKAAFSTFAEFQEKDVSIKPRNWSGKDKEVDSVKGALLKGRQLRFLSAYRAFLVNADFRYSNLEGADLRWADLRGAKFGATKLDGADVYYANLKNINYHIIKPEGLTGTIGIRLKRTRNWIFAFYSKDLINILGLPTDHNERLRKKDLSGYDLGGAKLSFADFKHMDLNSARLSGADLRAADFYGADLTGVDLSGAKMEGADLSYTVMEGALLQKAILLNAQLEGAKLGEANLAGAILENASFQNAYIWGANLKGANFKNANFKDCWIRHSDLRDSVNLTIDQLKETAGLQNTKLDPELTEQINKLYPHLLKE